VRWKVCSVQNINFQVKYTFSYRKISRIFRS